MGEHKNDQSIEPRVHSKKKQTTAQMNEAKDIEKNAKTPAELNLANKWQAQASKLFSKIKFKRGENSRPTWGRKRPR